MIPSAIAIPATLGTNDAASCSACYSCWPQQQSRWSTCLTVSAVVLVGILVWYLHTIDHLATSIALPASILQLSRVLRDPSLLADGVGCEIDDEDSTTDEDHDSSVTERQDINDDDDLTWDMDTDECHMLVLDEMRERFLLQCSHR